MSEPVVLPLGEAAFTIRLGEIASVENAERAAALADFIRQRRFDGVSEVVPSVAAVSVFYEPDAPGIANARAELSSLVAALGVIAPRAAAIATHAIPTRYDGVDIDEVAERTGLERAEVIRRHTAREYHVLALGFLPGWAYLGPLDPALSLPRRATPRTRVPAGAVAIMGAQTGVYPRVSPGGWHLIGSTSVVMFDAERKSPSLFRAGDRVRFVDTP
jgi:KipI family sensor histidine kinase inhibitor